MKKPLIVVITVLSKIAICRNQYLFSNPWERMSENNGGGKVPQYASTHPSDSTRIAQLRELMPKAMAEYNRAAATVPQRN